MRGWAQVLEDEDLSDPTSNTAKQSRTDFRLPYPFFSELLIVNLLKVTPLRQTSPERQHKTVPGILIKSEFLFLFRFVFVFVFSLIVSFRFSIS